MLVESRVGSVAVLVALAVGVLWNPFVERAARLLLFAPGYNDRAPLVTIDRDTVHYRDYGLISASAVTLWQQRSQSFEKILPLQSINFTSGLHGEKIAPGTMELVGAHPARGRFWKADEKNSVVVAARMAGLLGATIQLDGKPFRVVGVMPRDFHLLSREAEVWAPLETQPANLAMIGKLKPGISPAQAQRELQTIVRQRRLWGARKAEVITLRENRLRDFLFARSVLKWNLLLVLAISAGTFVRFIRTSRRTITWQEQSRYVGFLILKTMVALVAFGALWIVLTDPYWQRVIAVGGGLAMPVVFWTFLLLSWGAVFWCLRDQQNRCRVCLHVLRMPVASGLWSSLVLDRPRTEYICPYGHGTLYVPGTRLLDLDAVNWTPHDDMWTDLLKESTHQ